MKILFLLMLAPVFCKAQNYSTKDLSSKMRAVESKNTSQDKLITAQAILIMNLEDTIKVYKVLLSSDFNVDLKGIVTIPQLKILSDRLTKMEAKQ